MQSSLVVARRMDVFLFSMLEVSIEMTLMARQFKQSTHPVNTQSNSRSDLQLHHRSRADPTKTDHKFKKLKNDQENQSFFQKLALLLHSFCSTFALLLHLNVEVFTFQFFYAVLIPIPKILDSLAKNFERKIVKSSQVINVYP